jgi:hypothetical protein
VAKFHKGCKAIDRVVYLYSVRLIAFQTILSFMGCAIFLGLVGSDIECCKTVYVPMFPYVS